MYRIDNDKLTQSEFNGAVDFLTRINKIFYLIDESRIQENYNVWIKSLETLFYELSTEMTDDEINEARNNINIAKSELKKYTRQNSRTGQGYFDEEIENLLNDQEMNIRKVMKRAGLLYKKSDSDIESGFID